MNAFTISFSRETRQLISDVTVMQGDKKVTVRGLWDTGATSSCVSHDVVKQLGGTPTGKKTVKTPSGSKVMDTYVVDILLPNNVPMEECEVTDSEIGSQGLGALIGMDIISAGDFAVSNYDGKTVFTFRCPSQGRIDFVQGLRLHNIVGPGHGKGKRKKK